MLVKYIFYVIPLILLGCANLLSQTHVNDSRILYSGTTTINLSKRQKGVENKAKIIYYRPKEKWYNTNNSTETDILTSIRTKITEGQIVPYKDSLCQEQFDSQEWTDLLMKPIFVEGIDENFKKYQLVVKERGLYIVENYEFKLKFNLEYYESGLIIQSNFKLIMEDKVTNDKMYIKVSSSTQLQSDSIEGHNMVPQPVIGQQYNIHTPIDSIISKDGSSESFLQVPSEIENLLKAKRYTNFFDTFNWTKIDNYSSLNLFGGVDTVEQVDADLNVTEFYVKKEQFKERIQFFRFYQIWYWNGIDPYIFTNPVGYAPCSAVYDVDGKLSYIYPELNWTQE